MIVASQQSCYISLCKILTKLLWFVLLDDADAINKILRIYVSS